MWWIIALSVVLGLSALLLLAPVELEVNTASNTYRVRWWVLFGARLITEESDLVLEGKVLGFRKRWSLIKMLLDQEEKRQKRKKKKARKPAKKKRQMSLRTLRQLLSSFKVERFDISIDTGSVMWNAMLFPVAEVFHYSFRQKHPGLRINFKGIQYIDLKISNRGLDIVRAFIN